MSLDEVAVDACRLTDEEVRILRDTYRNMSLDQALSRPLQAWYADLARALNFALGTRALLWLDVVQAANVPSSWQDAVDTLPPEAGDCQ